MYDHGQSVDRIAVDKNIEADEVGFFVFARMVVHGSVAARHGFQPVKEIVDDFRERQLVGDDDTVGSRILKILLRATFFLAELHDVAHVFIGNVDVHVHVGLVERGYHAAIGQVRGVMDLDGFACGRFALVDDGRSRGDEITVEFALEAFLDDLHMQESEEAAAEAESQGR